MKYFTAIYSAPPENMKEWMSKPEAERKEDSDKMMKEWNDWLAAHKESVLNSISLGKTKRVSANGVEDAQNGMMVSSYVQAETPEAAAEIFKGHPHLQIPAATIEIMEAQQI